MIPDTLRELTGGSRRPFLRVDTHCIALHRIISIEYLAEGLLFRVGDGIFYNEDLAEYDADEQGTSVTRVSSPIVVINYINKDGEYDFVRRNGDRAETIWNYVIYNLASP